MNKPLKIAAIGCGGIMRSVYLPVLRSLTDIIQVAAVCDLDQARAESVAKNLGQAVAWTDARAMLAQGTFDAVMVLTSERATAQTARLVLEFNLPIFLEKPPASTAEELDQLMAAEAASQTYIYTAFNRRHMPLFVGRDFSHFSPRQIAGSLIRSGRTLVNFPNTAVHLLDSVQYFSGSLFHSWQVVLRSQPHPHWTVEAIMENGTQAILQFVPNGTEFAEFLELGVSGQGWKLQFPNEQAPIPEGEIVQSLPGATPVVTRPEKVTDFLEATGFRPCVRDFVTQFYARPALSPHRLAQTRATVKIMAEMRALAVTSTSG